MSGADDTPARLVEAAQRLFAEGGEESTSLRAITRAARSNAAAVHYHFGGRDELLRAVLERYLAPLNERRAQLLASAVAAYGEIVPVDVLAEAAVRPDLELLSALRVDQVQAARFLGRAHTLPGAPITEFMQRQFTWFADRVVPMLRQTLPDVGEAELRRRLRLVSSAVVGLFVSVPDPGEPGPLGTEDVDKQVRRLVVFVAAGLSAGPASGRRGAGNPPTGGPRSADRASAGRGSGDQTTAGSRSADRTSAGRGSGDRTSAGSRSGEQAAAGRGSGEQTKAKTGKRSRAAKVAKATAAKAVDAKGKR